MATSTSEWYRMVPGCGRLPADPHDGHLAPGSGGYYSHPSFLGLGFAELMEAGGAEPLNDSPLVPPPRLALSGVFFFLDECVVVVGIFRWTGLSDRPNG